MPKIENISNQSTTFETIDDLINETSAENVDYEEIDSDYLDYDDKCIIEKVQIYGTPDGNKVIPVLTDNQGQLKISADIIVQPIHYKEIVLKDLETTNIFQYTRSFDISEDLRNSFIIMNQHPNHAAFIRLLSSPNDEIYQIDQPEMVVEPKSFKILTPTRFLRYQKVGYQSVVANKKAILDLYYQAQGNI